MKKMKFRLEHVLRLREFEEKKARLELGNVVGRITAVNNEITEAKEQINISDDQFHNQLLKTRKMHEVMVFPFIMEGLKEKINTKKKELLALNAELEEKKNLLKEAEAKLKVIEKIKEKKYEIFKKEVEKKLQNEIDDHVIMKYGEKS